MGVVVGCTWVRLMRFRYACSPWLVMIKSRPFVVWRNDKSAV